MASFRRHSAPGIIVHSDRGSQYASNDYSKLLRDFKMESSMSRKGDCWDNAVTETLFGSLKDGRLDGMRFIARRHAKDEVMEWILSAISAPDRSWMRAGDRSVGLASARSR